MAIQSDPPPLGGVTPYEVNTWVKLGRECIHSVMKSDNFILLNY